jgi:hypothetical protein
MGYKYYLQLDDDTMINQLLEYNVVEKMQSSDYKLAVPYQIWQDSPEMLAGTCHSLWISISLTDNSF